MKKLLSYLFLTVLYFSYTINANSQVVYCADYSGPALWTPIGNPTSCSLPNGNFSFGPSLQINNFQAAQTGAIAQSLASSIPANNNFKVDFDFTLINSNSYIGMTLLAITENQMPTLDYAGIFPTENTGDAIELVIVNSSSGGLNNGYRIHATTKLGSTRVNIPGYIFIPQSLQFSTLYISLERTSSSNMVLAVYTDQIRSIMLNKKCFPINPLISNLDYIQHGGRPGYGCSRKTSGTISSLCISVNTPSDPCLDCNLASVYPNFTKTYNCQSGLGFINTNTTGGNSSGGYSYQWSNGMATANIGPVPSGTYFLTITDLALGCQSVHTTNLTFGTSMTSNFVCTTNLGTATAYMYNGIPPYSYQWSNGATTQSVSNLIAGTYTVTITDAQDCSVTRTKIIGPATVSGNIQITPNCDLGGNDLKAHPAGNGKSPYSYVWSTAATTQTINDTLAGTYSVTITDANGCSGVASVYHNPASILVASIQDVFDCSTNSVDLTASAAGGLAPVTYDWGAGIATAVITVSSTGNYTVTITDANGCTRASQISVNIPAVLSSSISNTFNCAANASVLTANVTGGLAPFAYDWSNSANTQSITSLVAASYSVTITDANGCTTLASASTIASPVPLSASVQQVFNCSTNSMDLTATAAGGSAPFFYVWSNIAVGPVNTISTTGSYSVVISDALGCEVEVNFNVNIPDPLNLSLQGSFNCNSNTGSITSSLTGGAAPFVYLWSNGATSANASGLVQGLHTLTVTDSNGCSVSTSLNIAPPVLTVSFQSTFDCAAGTGSITANPNGGQAPYSYLWGNTATSQTISPIVPGVYSVKITDANGCTVIGSHTIASPNITANFQVTNSCPNVCNGTLTITNTQGGTPTYLYNLNGMGFSTQTYYTNLCAGSHQVEIMDANGCRVQFNGNINIIQEDWPKHPKTVGTDYSQGNGIDVKKDKYLVGQFFNRIEFENTVTPYSPITLTSQNGSHEDAYIVKYDDCGAAWAFSFGSANNQEEGVVVRSIAGDDEIDPDIPGPVDTELDNIIMGANIFGPLPNGIIDAEGNAITNTINGVDLTLATSGVSKGLILSIDGTDGSINWVYMIGENPSQPTEINDLKISGANIYAIGNVFGASFDIGTDNHVLEGDWDIFLMNISLAGVFTTGNATTWGTIREDNGEALDIAEVKGNIFTIYTTGFVSHKPINVQGTIYSGSNYLKMTDLFVAQFSLGNPVALHFQAHRSIGYDAGLDITAPGESVAGIGFVVTGYFEHALDLWSSSIPIVTQLGTSYGNRDAFVAAFDDLFDHVWSDYVAGTSIDVGQAICYNPSLETVFVAGEYSGFSSGFITSGATLMGWDRDIFVNEFDVYTGASMMQLLQPGDGIEDRAFDIEFNQTELYTAGQFGNTGNLNFPTAPIPSLPAQSFVHDSYFARLDYTGTFFRERAEQVDIIEQMDEFQIYPNPFREEVQLKWDTDNPFILEITDLNGKVVFVDEVATPGKYNRRVDLSQYTDGLYFLKLTSQDEMKVFKLIKQ